MCKRKLFTTLIIIVVCFIIASMLIPPFFIERESPPQELPQIILNHIRVAVSFYNQAYSIPPESFTDIDEFYEKGITYKQKKVNTSLLQTANNVNYTEYLIEQFPHIKFKYYKGHNNDIIADCFYCKEFKWILKRSGDIEYKNVLLGKQVPGMERGQTTAID